jgi:hypothetical protein
VTVPTRGPPQAVVSSQSSYLNLLVQQSLAGPANATMESEASSNSSQLVGSNIDSLYDVIDRDK